MADKSEMLYIRDKIDEQSKMLYDIHGVTKGIERDNKAYRERLKTIEKKVDKHDTAIDQAQGSLNTVYHLGALITVILGTITLIAYFKPI